VAAAVADRRQQLLAAAREAFARSGYHGTTVRDVCDRCSVSVGTFYLYFANKEACFVGLIDALYEEVVAAAAAARADLADPVDKLVASVGAVLRTLHGHAPLARIVLVHAPGTHPAFDARLRELHIELAQLVRRDLDEAVATGAIPPQDTQTAALAIIGAVYEVTVAHLDRRTDRAIEESLAALAALVRNAIGSRR
jgi:TetR/AcrR family fatty acid metabolism transcriptional regulator